MRADLAPALVVRGAARTRAAAIGFAVLLGSAAGGLAALHGQDLGPFGLVTTLPVPALLALCAIIPLVVLGFRNPWISLAVFAVWLPFEDLARKFAGNDIRVYGVKEALYLVVLLALARQLRGTRALSRATGRGGFWLVLLLAWALAMAVPSALRDPRIPLVGLRLDFAYIPLVGIGYLLAIDGGRLRRSMQVLSVLGGAVLLLGVIQAIVGPQFLAPGRSTPGLGHLVLERSLPGGVAVYRPTGTFVDPGRYASMALVSLAVALAAYSLRPRRRARLLATSALGLATVAVWLSGARAAFVGAVVLVAAAAFGQVRARMRRSAGRLLLAIGAGVGALVFVALLSPGAIADRSNFYAATLDPRSSENEWSFRWQIYGDSTTTGIRLGGVIGRGTGTQTLGLQYLYGGEARSTRGLYFVESGYGTVAYELGVVGLLLWAMWSLQWWRRIRASMRAVRGTRYAPAARVLGAWLFFFLFLAFFAGKSYFQNYISNAFFWLLSGIVFGLPVAAATSHADDAVMLDGAMVG